MQIHLYEIPGKNRMFQIFKGKFHKFIFLYLAILFFKSESEIERLFMHTKTVKTMRVYLPYTLSK